MDTLLNIVECSVCLNEVPISEARSAEATDYVAYFCGLDCYQQWHFAATETPQEAEAKRLSQAQR